MVLGWLRLLKNIAWFWIGYLRVVRPLVRRGGLVVGDRWAYSYAVQPGPLAFFGPEWLGWLMPQPDLVINLSAPPGVIVARKDELSAEQAALELDRWRKLPVPRLETFDASVPASEVVDAIEARLADPQPRIEPVGS